MDLFLLLKALIMGIVEGLTEFLPISSTGHLIIVGKILKFPESLKTFQIFIQLAAILAVVWLYRQRFSKVLVNLPREKSARQFVFNLVIAFLPAGVFGWLFYGIITKYLFSTVTVAGALIVGGFVLLAVEKKGLKPAVRVESVDAMSWKDALKIGFAQCVGMFPGVSRAGATIIGGMLFGLSRTAATEFSFFIAIPTMFAATLYDLWKSRNDLQWDDLGVFVVGFITSFMSAVLVIKSFLRFVSKNDFTAFAYYRIIFGVLVLWYFW
jgi:undecaprenyl-diphosphatase